MLKAVAGRTVGAVFVGEGRFAFSAQSELEKSQTARYNDGQAALDEPFDHMVMLFTGDEAGKLESQAGFSAGSIGPAGTGLVDDLRKMFRKRLHTNIEAQVLASVAAGEDVFLALFHGKRNGDLIFSIDPLEAEEVSLARYRGEEIFDTWNSFSLPKGEPGAHQGDLVDTIHVGLNTRIQTNADIQGDADVTFRALRSGPRMLPFRLAPKLRVTEVTDGSTPLRFIQENEKEDADLWVLLPAALEKDREYTWRFRYGGEGVVQKAGQGNFYVGARTSWYPKPDVANEFFTDLATYRMRFEVPRKNTLVATGKLLQRSTEGKSEVSEWETVVPYTVAGFNYGQFKVKTLQHAGYEVSVYTNPQLNDELNELRVQLEQNPDIATQLGITTGGLNTTRMAEKIGAEAAQALALFSAYFGEIPYKSISVSQQPSGVFGQSWPSLVFYPYSGLLDNTMKNQLGLNRQDKGFFEEVGPHEIAHQWWGHMAPWKDYHEQWLSEGIAEFSAGLYLHHFYGEDRFRQYLKSLRDQILVSTTFSQRPIDVGPISLGYRLESEKTRGAYRLVYAKGAYIMHMLRMMLYDHVQKRDVRFRAMMRDFVQTVKNKPVTTADLAAVCNKHIGGDISWFFQQWVMGTTYPKVEIAYKVEPDGEKRNLVVKARVSNAPEDFIVVMPVLIHFKNSRSAGVVRMTGEGFQSSVTLPEEPVRVEFNPLDSVLCDLNVRKM